MTVMPLCLLLKPVRDKFQNVNKCDVRNSVYSDGIILFRVK